MSYLWKYSYFSRTVLNFVSQVSSKGFTGSELLLTKLRVSPVIWVCGDYNWRILSEENKLENEKNCNRDLIEMRNLQGCGELNFSDLSFIHVSKVSQAWILTK